MAQVAAPPARAGVSAGFADSVLTVAPGDTFVVQIVVPVAADSFNAFDAPIRFDPARLAFVATTPAGLQRGPLMTAACSNTFVDFHATTDSLKISLSLLCAGTYVAGPGTLYQVKFRALAPTGPTAVVLGPSTTFYRAGLRVLPVTKRGLTVQIGANTGVVDPAGRTGVRLSTPFPNPSIDGAGTFAFELPAPDVVKLELLDVAGRRVAVLASGRLDAGRHDVPVALALRPGRYRLRLATGAGTALERSWTVLR